MVRFPNPLLIRKCLQFLGVILLGTAIVPVHGAHMQHDKNGVHGVTSASSLPGAQVGKASWYGGYDIGRLTASGERYRRMDVTAAHRRLPFNTWVLVTNLRNGKQVVVRINDRGPYVKGRIIDLSFEAAKSIGMVNTGVTPVHLLIL